MTEHVRISARISETTWERLDQYARETGLKKSSLIEDAIVAHLETLDMAPSGYALPGRLVVDVEAWAGILSELETPCEPAAPLRELMRRHRDAD